MTTPSNALQVAIYARLKGFSALTSLLKAPTSVFDFVPESAKPPFVVIGDDTAIDWSSKSGNGWEATLTIHAWDFEKGGRKSVKAILGAIYDALHRQEASIAISGFTLVEIAFEFEQTFQEAAAEGQGDRYYHGVQRYRALIETTS